MSGRLDVDGAVQLSGTMLESQQDEAEIGVEVGVEAELEALPLMRGTTLSRYLLLERVGAGGMGVVWAAYDPELDRKVAIKLLRPRRSGAEASDDKARTRLVREAQAMARLSHPNVIPVHDVGEHGGQVFVAMEFVDGPTLGRWARGAKRPWREIVEMFVQAGRGLAEAHQAGLVHRDFKPDNVLISGGRARVTDFGLARSVESVTLDGEDGGAGLSAMAMEEGLGEAGSALSTPLTRTGIMIGTPAYMAPEQFEAGTFEARSDQFSFCVALWEALYGARPFAGETLAALERSVLAGTIESPSNEGRVPGFIEQALRRGLALEPGDRFSTMDELLDELRRDPAAGRRRWLAAGGLLASVAAVAMLAPMLSEPEAPAPVCPDASVHLEGIWDDARRGQLQAAVLASAVVDPATSWAQIAGAVDSYASSWLTMHHDACEATHVRHEQSQELLDLRMQCLDVRRVDLEAKLELLASGEAKVIDEANTLLGGLPAVEPCGRRAYLEASAPIPADEALAMEVAALRGALAEVRAQLEVGQHDVVIPALRELYSAAKVTGYAPLEAETLSELAFASGSSGTPEETRELLEQAVTESIRTGLDAQAARAAIELAYVVGVRLEDVDEGMRWTRRIEAWHDRLDAAPLSRARLAFVTGMISMTGGELEVADEHLVRGLALLGIDESLAGLDELGPAEIVASSWGVSSRALVSYYRGDFREADELLGAALPLVARLHGPQSVKVQVMTLNRAAIGILTGDWVEAEAALGQVLPKVRQGREDRPTHYALTLLNLAELRGHEQELGLRPPEAMAELRALVDETQAAIEAAYPGSNVYLATSLTVAAQLDRLEGRFAEAALEVELAVETIAKLERPEAVQPHEALRPELERALLTLARGELDEAQVQLEALITKTEAAGSSGKPNLARTLTALARIQIERDQRAEAIAGLERALTLWAELAPAGHPESLPALELLAGLDADRATQLRGRAGELRERIARERES